MTSREQFAARYKDPRWQKMRLQIMERDGFTCLSCQSKDKSLNVHHSYYVKGRFPWEYPAHSLQTLCEPCHLERHDELETMREEGSVLSVEEDALGFALGGDPKNIDFFWDVAVALALAKKEHVKWGQVYRAASEAINQIIFSEP